MDLAYFNKAISAASADIKLGYAAITWGGNDPQAMDDIAALGYPGIQLRSNILKEFKDPAEVQGLLQKNHLTLVALSSGGVNVDSPDDAAEIEKLGNNTGNAIVHGFDGLDSGLQNSGMADHVRIGKIKND